MLFAVSLQKVCQQPPEIETSGGSDHESGEWRAATFSGPFARILSASPGSGTLVFEAGFLFTVSAELIAGALSAPSAPKLDDNWDEEQVDPVEEESEDFKLDTDNDDKDDDGHGNVITMI